MTEETYCNDLEELNRLFYVKPVNGNVFENVNEYKYEEVKNLQYTFNKYIDDDTLRKIREFERDNPEKIKQWQKEEEERQREYFIQKTSGLFGGYGNDNVKTVLRICLKCCPNNKFVSSVAGQYFKNGKISDKQFDVLEKIARQYVR